MVATADRRRSARPACSRPTWRRRAGAGQPRHLADGRAAAVVLNSGNANAATGSAAVTTPGACASSPARALGCAPTECSCAPPASSGSRCRWRRSRAASRAGRGSSAPTVGRRGGRRRDAHHRHRPQGGRTPRPSRRARAAGRRHGQGCGDARARDGDDARRPHHRRRGRRRTRCTPRSSARSTTRSTRSSSTGARAPTTRCSCSPRRRGQRPDRVAGGTRTTRSRRR